MLLKRLVILCIVEIIEVMYFLDVYKTDSKPYIINTDRIDSLITIAEEKIKEEGLGELENINLTYLKIVMRQKK